jgi:hypothetical protein
MEMPHAHKWRKQSAQEGEHGLCDKYRSITWWYLVVVHAQKLQAFEFRKAFQTAKTNNKAYKRTAFLSREVRHQTIKMGGSTCCGPKLMFEDC